jgi:glycosyltransferase involved in cell wall biosynthesis
MKKLTSPRGANIAANADSKQPSARAPTPGRGTLRIAMLGTRGVPAEYGGFETAVEEIGQRLASRGHIVTVFCRGGEAESSVYKGMQTVHRPMLRLKVGETLSHTAACVAHRAARGADVAVVFNAANAPLLPVLLAAGVPVALNVDGLEWMRAKWNAFGRRYYLACEKLATRLATELIADAPGIRDYYLKRHGVDARMIPYGGNIVTAPAFDRLKEVGLRARGYHLVVARLEPENNVHVVLDGYRTTTCTLPLVVVGATTYSRAYARRLSSMAAADPRIRLVGAIWDQELLDALYAGAATYVHGHSVGGTNPSLLRAMGAGAHVLSFDVRFNRDVLGDAGRYWTSANDLAASLPAAERDQDPVQVRNALAVDRVAKQYTSLIYTTPSPRDAH